VRRLAGALGIDLDVVSIEAATAAVEALVDSAAGGGGNVSAERIRSGLCGDVVSACAAAGGRLALATADKTDLALGRPAPAEAVEAALAPIGDVQRRDVLRLAGHLQRPAERIPRRHPEGGPRGRKDLAGGVSRRNPAPCNPEPRRGVRNLALQRQLALSPFGYIHQHKEFRPSKAFRYQLSAVSHSRTWVASSAES